MFRLSSLFSLVRKTVCSAPGDMGKVRLFYAVRKGFKPGVYGSW